MQFSRWFRSGVRACSALVLGALSLSTATARAEIHPCGLGSGAVSCPSPTSCGSDAECFAIGLGRCVTNSSGGGGVCALDCSGIYTCNVGGDCPSIDSLTTMCVPAALTGASGVCEFYDASDRAVLTFCTHGGAVTPTRARDCFSGGSWALGDCDLDHVPNGMDMDPCSGTNTTSVPAIAAPFCLPGHICEGTSDVCAPFVRCADSTDCASGAALIGGTGWECSPIPNSMSAVSFCHPTCDATVHCSGTTDCSVLGSCHMVDPGSTLSMCLPGRLSTCVDGCSADPLDWATAQGDCDGDGAQNGCDTHPCVGTDPPCTVAVACTMVDVPDAGSMGVDAGNAIDGGASPSDGGTISPFEDAAVDDAGSDDAGSDDAGSDDAASGEDDASHRRDASTSTDGGGSAMDATGGTVITPGLGFGGGGGCRCAAAGARSRSGTGAMLSIVSIAGVLARRRRPRR